MINYIILTLFVIVGAPIVIAIVALLLYCVIMTVASALILWIRAFDLVFRTELNDLYMRFIYVPLARLADSEDEDY